MVGKEEESTSWAKRQCATSVNFRSDSTLWMLLCGGLNMQSLHHVAPGIASCHLVDLFPKFKVVCAKHGVEVKEVANIAVFFHAFMAWIRQLTQLSAVCHDVLNRGAQSIVQEAPSEQLKIEMKQVM